MDEDQINDFAGRLPSGGNKSQLTAFFIRRVNDDIVFTLGKKMENYNQITPAIQQNNGLACFFVETITFFPGDRKRSP